MILRIGSKTVFATGRDARELAMESEVPQATAHTGSWAGQGYNNVFAVGFDGEKNLGEMGPIKKYMLNHEALRLRSWQLYLESEVCQMVFRRYARWVIGAGLKLQAEPKKDVLAGEGIKLEPESFNKQVESRFKLFAASKGADWRNMKSLHGRAKEAFINAIVGGDVLVILRYVDDEVKVELIDGAHIGTPGDKMMDSNVRHGVHLDKRGQHIGYWVRKEGSLMDYEYIPARGKGSNALMAFMVYGLEYRLDNVRGIPLISAVMETTSKMERYKEATLGSAEERAKIPYFIEHGITSTGENPLQKQLAKVTGFTKPGDEVPVDAQFRTLADTVAVSTNKQVFNLPNDSKMVALESDTALEFQPFFTVNINLVCATIGIPPNVAMMLYDANFSASRAALKDWEHTLNVERTDFGQQFYDNFYALWLDTEILKNKIAAPGYLSALADGNKMAVLAYRSCRWVGATVPHIDPLKEVKAEREKLGSAGAHLPLTTLEAATEALNGGDSYGNMEQYGKEIEHAGKQGLEPVVVQPAKGNGSENGD